MKQQQMAAGEFETKCLSVLEDVERGQEVVITRHGKPVARLLPIEDPKPKPIEEYLASDGKPLFGRMKGTGRILGDIVNSTGERWDADE